MTSGALLASGSTLTEAPQGTSGSSFSVADFGARGDGTDQAAAVQRAYDALQAQGGGTLFFPAGVYAVSLTLTSRDVHLRGAGAGATRLIPLTADGVILTALYRNGAQTAVYISDLDLVGEGRLQSTLFRAGGENYVAHAEFSGGTHFERVRFHNADISIERRFGSIVLVIDQCTFTDANYHFYAESSDGTEGGYPMHAGCTFVSRSRLLGFRHAMFYVKSTVQGSGQIVFSQNIVENGSGFVFYIDDFNATVVPGIVIRDQWNENNATAGGIEIGGRRHRRPLFLYARDCTVPIIIENTPLGATILERSSLCTRDCDLSDFTSTTDVASTVTHERAYAFTGTQQGTCRSIAGPSLASGLRTPWFAMVLPVTVSPAFGNAVLQRFDGAGPITLCGERTAITVSANDPVVSAAAQDLVMAAGERLFPASFAVEAGQWLVISYVARIISGGPVEVQLNGERGMSGAVQITESAWKRYVGIVAVEARSAAQHMMHTARAKTTLRIGGIAVIAFGTRQQAVDYANAGLFPS